MVVIYLCIVLASVTQSATTKLYNRPGNGTSSAFNAIKAFSALLCFAAMAFAGFSLHLPTLIFGLTYGLALCLSMYSGYRALCLGPMALTSMLASFSVVIPLLYGVFALGENLRPMQYPAFLLLFLSILLTNLDKT